MIQHFQKIAWCIGSRELHYSFMKFLYFLNTAMGKSTGSRFASHCTAMSLGIFLLPPIIRRYISSQSTD